MSFLLKAGRVPLLPCVVFPSHCTEPRVSLHLPRHPYALYANMEQNGEFKSATLCLIPPTLVPSKTAEDGPRQSMHTWQKMVTNEE